MASVTQLLFMMLAVVVLHVNGFRKKAAEDAQVSRSSKEWNRKKTGVKNKVPLTEDLDDEAEEMVYDEKAKNVKMPLCWGPLVKNTCRGFYDNGKDYKPARELLQEIYDASSSDVDAFFAAMNVKGNPLCKDLCGHALTWARDNAIIVPEEHDKGCHKEGEEWICDLDFSPKKIAADEKFEQETTEDPDHGGEGHHAVPDGAESFLEVVEEGMKPRRVTAVPKPKVHVDEATGEMFATVRKRPSGFINLANVVGDGPLPQTPEQMALKTLRMFRIYTSHPDDDKKIHNVEDDQKSSLISLNGTKRSSATAAIQTSHAASRAWVSTVLAQLNQGATGTYRSKWFGQSGSKTEAEIRARLIRVYNFMDRELGDMKFFYPGDSATRVEDGKVVADTSCGGSTLAYVWKWRTNEVGYTETQGPQCTFSEAGTKRCAVDTSDNSYVVYLCRYWFESFGEIDRTSTIVHEAVHHTGPSDISYESTKMRTGITQAEQLNNAANYQNFGEEVTLNAWGCANQDEVTGLPYRCTRNEVPGPCSCSSFTSMCDDATHGTSIRTQCPAMCGQCEAPDSGSFPRRRRTPAATPTPTPAPTPPRRRRAASSGPTDPNCQDTANAISCHNWGRLGYFDSNSPYFRSVSGQCCHTMKKYNGEISTPAPTPLSLSCVSQTGAGGCTIVTDCGDYRVAVKFHCGANSVLTLKLPGYHNGADYGSHCDNNCASIDSVTYA